MIETRSLSRQFNSSYALEDVTFRAAPGERIAIVGANGAGKTTLLRILATYLPATAGYASIGGLDLLHDSLAIRQMTGYLPENAPLYHDIRVVEYLKYRGRLRRMSRLHLNRRLHDVISFCDLSTYRNARIDTLSNGIRRRVGIADALLNEPRILLLDDPLVACDPYQAEKITEMLTSETLFADRTLIFTSHSRETVRAAATRLIFLDRGTICADTTDLTCLDGHSLQTLFGQWQNDQSERTPTE